MSWRTAGAARAASEHSAGFIAAFRRRIQEGWRGRLGFKRAVSADEVAAIQVQSHFRMTQQRNRFKKVLLGCVLMQACARGRCAQAHAGAPAAA